MQQELSELKESINKEIENEKENMCSELINEMRNIRKNVNELCVRINNDLQNIEI